MSIDTDGLDPRPAGLPLYPWGEAYINPPGHPCKGFAPLHAWLPSIAHTHTHTTDREKQELALFFFSLDPNSSRSDCSYPLSI